MARNTTVSGLRKRKLKLKNRYTITNPNMKLITVSNENFDW